MNSPGFQELASITDPTKQKYAEKWGHAFFFAVDADLAGPRGAWLRVEKWKLAHELGEDDSWLFFTGTDTAITNQDVDLVKRFFLDRDDFDLIISADGNGLQSDSFIMRNCEATILFLERVLKWEGLVANEQMAMNIELSGSKNFYSYFSQVAPFLHRKECPTLEHLERLQGILNQSPVRVRVVPQRMINAYANELYPEGDTASPNQHHPGDFILHLPGLTNETRIKYLKEILCPKTTKPS